MKVLKNRSFVLYQIGIVLVLFAVISCTSTTKKTNNKMEENTSQSWFEKADWKHGWAPVPDETVDAVEFEKQYLKNKERWDMAFKFLAETDLQNIEVGKYELDGKNLFVSIDEYETRDEEKTRYEAHRKYADIQYLIKGKEEIGVVPFETTTVTDEYIPEKDICFLTSPKDNYRPANADKFFVFFPDDAHRPCKKAAENMQVKKVVVKILIN